MRPARGLARAAALGLVCAALAAGAVEPAPGGAPLLLAAESARATVVGVVREPHQTDVHGWAARLEVDRVLAGSVEPGTTLRIGWEELARGRPARFADSERVLIALVDLPTWSLWRSRFPRGDALAVAAEGAAFLRAPDDTSLELLGRYLALPAETRDREEGVNSLCALVASAHPGLAAGALERLAGVPGLATRLGEPAQTSLSAALHGDTRPEALQAHVLALIGSRQLAALRPLVVEQARPGGPLEAEAWTVLTVLDGDLDAKHVAELLAREQPALRVLAVRHAQGTPSEPKVAELMSADPAPEVRGAAVEAWLAWRGEPALEAAEPALFDADRRVRGIAASAIGRLGSAAVPRLRALVADRSAEQALGPIAALGFAGPAGAAALREIAASHPDEKVRVLARLALGRDLKPH